MATGTSVFALMVLGVLHAVSGTPWFTSDDNAEINPQHINAKDFQDNKRNEDCPAKLHATKYLIDRAHHGDHIWQQSRSLADSLYPITTTDHTLIMIKKANKEFEIDLSSDYLYVDMLCVSGSGLTKVDVTAKDYNGQTTTKTITMFVTGSAFMSGCVTFDWLKIEELHFYCHVSGLNGYAVDIWGQGCKVDAFPEVQVSVTVPTTPPVVNPGPSTPWFTSDANIEMNPDHMTSSQFLTNKQSENCPADLDCTKYLIDRAHHEDHIWQQSRSLTDSLYPTNTTDHTLIMIKKTNKEFMIDLSSDELYVNILCVDSIGITHIDVDAIDYDGQTTTKTIPMFVTDDSFMCGCAAFGWLMIQELHFYCHVSGLNGYVADIWGQGCKFDESAETEVPPTILPEDQRYQGDYECSDDGEVYSVNYDHHKRKTYYFNSSNQKKIKKHHLYNSNARTSKYALKSDELFLDLSDKNMTVGWLCLRTESVSSVTVLAIGPSGDDKEIVIYPDEDTDDGSFKEGCGNLEWHNTVRLELTFVNTASPYYAKYLWAQGCSLSN